MILKAYPESWARHAALHAAAGRWQRRGLLTTAQRAAIEAAYPVDYYRPGNWLRLGLFVGTLLAVGSVVSGMLLPLLEGVGVFVYALLVMAGATTLLELLIRSPRHYRSGVDNALLYTALIAWQAFWVLLVSKLFPGYPVTLPQLVVALLPSLLMQLLAVLRYADPVVAATAFGTALVLLGQGLLLSSLGQLLLPFAVMLAAGLLLLALRQLPARADYWYYRAASGTLRTLALATLYLAGNYLVVREGHAALLPEGGPTTEIPLAPLFWALTGLVPLLYLWLGLRRHDRLLLWLGLLTLAFALYTVRYYHSVLPPAVAATLAGVLLTGGALGALRYLRRPRHGLTAEADDEVRPPLNLESFITIETAHVPAAPVPGFEFGGGSSGGGGAEAQW